MYGYKMKLVKCMNKFLNKPKKNLYSGDLKSIYKHYFFVNA